MMQKKIAVIGAGIFGISTALELAKEPSFCVELFETNSSIMTAASGINQGRLHRGYHYPRCLRNAYLFARTINDFQKEYSQALFKPDQYIYCIAREDSKTSGLGYEQFCQQANLPLKKVTSPLVDRRRIISSYEVEEQLINLSILRELCLQKLAVSPVTVRLNTHAPTDLPEHFDQVVYCVYASSNVVIDPEMDNLPIYRYQLCEKPVIRLPEEFANKSVVVFDGPFGAVDPWGNSGNHVLTHVTEATHANCVSQLPEFDRHLLELCDRGVINNPPVTRFPLMIKSAQQYMPGLSKASLVGSMFTIKILPLDKSRSDYRPTIVRRLNEKMTVVLGGKIVTAVSTAKKISSELRQRMRGSA